MQDDTILRDRITHGAARGVLALVAITMTTIAATRLGDVPGPSEGGTLRALTLALTKGSEALTLLFVAASLALAAAAYARLTGTRSARHVAALALALAAITALATTTGALVPRPAAHSALALYANADAAARYAWSAITLTPAALLYLHAEHRTTPSPRPPLWRSADLYTALAWLSTLIPLHITRATPEFGFPKGLIHSPFAYPALIVATASTLAALLATRAHARQSDPP